MGHTNEFQALTLLLSPKEFWTPEADVSFVLMWFEVPFGSSVVAYVKNCTSVWRKNSAHIKGNFNVLVADAVRIVRLSNWKEWRSLRGDFFVHLSCTEVDNFCSRVTTCLQQYIKLIYAKHSCMSDFFKKIRELCWIICWRIPVCSTSLWASIAMDFASKFIFIRSDELFSVKYFRRLLAAVHFSHAKF